MALKKCDECGEMADEAKAFCPACGNPFVAEEQRTEASKFDSLDGTMQLGNTMFNMMLSDMGLNTKERAGLSQQQQVEVLKPVAPAPAPKPVAPKPAAAPAPAAVPQPAVKKSGSNNTWFIIGGIVIAVLLLLIFLAIAFVVYQMYFR